MRIIICWLGDDGDDGPESCRWILNTFEPRRDDREVTVTTDSLGGFENPLGHGMAWPGDAATSVEHTQPSARLDHDTTVSWSSY